MPKGIKIKLDKDPEVVSETVVESPVVEKVEVVEKSVFPEVNAKGRFIAVAHENGYVVYNPANQRVSGVLGKVVADDMVLRQNIAAHIK
jgi:hypothetical protein